MNSTVPKKAETEDALSAHWQTLPFGHVEHMIDRVYGIQGNVVRLSSERDETFKLTTGTGDAYVLKIANPLEDTASLAFQDAALTHLEAISSPVPLPRLMLTKAGDRNHDLKTDDGIRKVRLLTYLPGEQAYRLQPSEARNENLGRSLAVLGQGLASFNGRPPPGKLLWDITHTLDLVDLLKHVDPGRRAAVRTVLQQFERRVSPVFGSLSRQVVHNDFNLHNILVDPSVPFEIAGVIDFGDMVYAPRVNDLAVALAYHVETDDWRTLVGAVLRGYSRVVELSGTEIALLPTLIMARLAITIIISEYRAASHPENRDYIMRNHRAAWLGLQKLVASSEAELEEFVSSYCEE